ncbi:hypothetical protein FVEN_g6570 [Fusarium venenatum]|uniref:Uncharacterized protein n=2 Tax=Fusarium venenatum TaxID=56646 RepID=A0A2L2TMH7_9HYPO|nr:uncharacterized protein FVRRES_04871 [Fusarium venenatum]KAG8355776.1 hypothetical protein FVEN_g6570 [Fusarium venenatum]CEI60435.1 unnamed protein product [Fusarium venenatum]
MQYVEKMALARVVMVLVGAYIPSIFLLLNSLCSVRSSKDCVRTAFTYLKFALLIFSAHALFDAATYGIFLGSSIEFADISYDDPDYDWGRYATIMQVLGICLNVFQEFAKMSEMITDILIAIILLRLSAAILNIYSGSPMGKNLRLASYAMAFVLGTLVLAVFGLRMRYIFETSYGDLEIGDASALKGLQVDFSVKVLLLVISLAVLVRVIMVKRQVKADKNLTWASTMLLIASVVWLLHTSFAMASMAAWDNLIDVWGRPPVRYEFYNYIFDVIFKIWPQFAVLVIVYVMGRAKANGIWSKQQASSKHVEEGK